MIKKIMMLCVAAMMTIRTWAATEIVNGIEWVYEVSNDGAIVVEAFRNGEELPWALDSNGVLVIPEKLGGYSVREIGDKFMPGGHDETLKKVILPNSIVRIGKSAFEGNNALSEINFPEGLKELSFKSFEECGLEKIIIPEVVTEIPVNCFRQCSSLVEVHLPKSVKKIRMSAFEECPKLTVIYCAGDKPNLESYALLNSPNVVFYCGIGEDNHIVSVIVAEGYESMGKVTGGKADKVGAMLTLKATPNKGYIFDGWYDAEGNPFPNDRDFRLAQLPYTVGQSDVEVYAKFAKLSGNVTVSAKAEAGQIFAGWYTDDAFVKPYISSDGKDYRTASMSYPVPLYAALFPRFVSADEDMQISLVCDPLPYYDANSPMSLGVLVDSCSLPTVTAANLPTGLKFDAKTLMISGTPTKPGEGKDVKFTVKNLTNKKGETFIVSIKIGDARAPSLPDLKYNDANGYAPFVPGASQDMATVLGASTMDVLAQGGWTVSGLPAGMKFDSKTGKFSGAPTKANENCTVTFKKGSETATITLRTGKAPILELEPVVVGSDMSVLPIILDESVEVPDISKFKLTGAGSHLAGKEVTLGATAPAGWVFAGWQEVESQYLGIGMCENYGYADMNLDAHTNDTRVANYKFKMPTTERIRLKGVFIHQSQDALISAASDVGCAMTYLISSEEDIVQSRNDMAVTAVRECFRSYMMHSSFPTVTVTGLPLGLKFDAKTLLLSGKVTAKPGYYYATFTAKNASGYTLTVPVKFVVSDMHQQLPLEDPSDVNTMPSDFFANEFMMLEKLAAGAPVGYEDSNENWGYMISGKEIPFGHPGCPEGGLISFSGLPKGMTAKEDWIYTDSIGKFTAWYLEGVPSVAGWYTVSVIGKGFSGFEIEDYKYSKHIAVVDTPSKYVFVKVGQGEGTVTGSGVWNAGKAYSVKATPKSGYIFAGWYQDEMCTVPAENWTFGNECDYRKPSQKWTLEADFLRMRSEPGVLYAKFVPKSADDGNVDITAIGSYSESDWGGADIYNEYRVNLSEDFIWNINPTEDGYANDELGLLIDSVAEPTVTVKGLPKEFEFEGSYADGLYIIECDGSPDPGEYIAELSVKTSTLNNPVMFKFPVRVPNYRHWELPLDYDNGYTLIPGAIFDYEVLLPGVDLTGWTVSGLPAGMTFDAKTGKIKGAPTAAEKSYTVWFKRGDEAATVTMRTGALPPLNITSYLIDDGNDYPVVVPESRAKEFKVTGAGGYAIGKAATLSATAPKGYVFAGWYTDAECTIPVENGTQDYRTSSSYKFTMPEEATSETGVRLYAMFIHASHDFAGVEDLSDWGDGITVEINQSESMPADFIKNAVFSGSLPTVTVKGLPAGLKFDAKTLLISGKAKYVLRQ